MGLPGRLKSSVTSFSYAQPPYTLFQRSKVCSEILIRGITSVTGAPVSACFSANAIRYSVYRDSSRPSDWPKGFKGPGNSRSKWAKRQGGRQSRMQSGRYFRSFVSLRARLSCSHSGFAMVANASGGAFATARS